MPDNKEITKKYKIQQMQSNGDMLTLYPKTQGDIVVFSKDNEGNETSVNEKIGDLSIQITEKVDKSTTINGVSLETSPVIIYGTTIPASPDLTSTYLIDSDNKIPLSLLPDVIVGQLIYGGTVDINESGNAMATLSSQAQTELGIADREIKLIDSQDDNTSTTPKEFGYKTNNQHKLYYIVSNGGTFANLPLVVGDWLIATNSKWERIANIDAVRSVNGKVGDVVLRPTDIFGTPTYTADGATLNEGVISFNKIEQNAGTITTGDPISGIETYNKTKIDDELGKKLENVQIKVGDSTIIPASIASPTASFNGIFAGDLATLGYKVGDFTVTSGDKLSAGSNIITTSGGQIIGGTLGITGALTLGNNIKHGSATYQFPTSTTGNYTLATIGYVRANPTSTPTSTLTNLQIGSTIYKIDAQPDSYLTSISGKTVTGKTIGAQIDINSVGGSPTYTIIQVGGSTYTDTLMVGGLYFQEIQNE